MRLPLLRIAFTGPSMLPTLRPGDQLLVRRDALVRVGDVVAARRPDRPFLVVVKRVERVTADGRWWLAGDNAAASDDSRVFGPVHSEDLLGRVVWRYWPPLRRRPIRRNR